MGCNTSQEVQPVESTNDAEDSVEKKVTSAIRSITQDSAAVTEEIIDIDDTPEVVEAATKIQAVFRGHQARRTMKAGDDASAEREPTKAELEAEFSPDDKELCHAATKIQATFRGHVSRKKNDDTPAAPDKVDETLDIDLTDPDLHNAATKIQASFRGHKVRKETDEVGATGGKH